MLHMKGGRPPKKSLDSVGGRFSSMRATISKFEE